MFLHQQTLLLAHLISNFIASLMLSLSCKKYYMTKTFKIIFKGAKAGLAWGQTLNFANADFVVVHVLCLVFMFLRFIFLFISPAVLPFFYFLFIQVALCLLVSTIPCSFSFLVSTLQSLCHTYLHLIPVSPGTAVPSLLGEALHVYMPCLVLSVHLQIPFCLPESVHWYFYISNYLLNFLVWKKKILVSVFRSNLIKHLAKIKSSANSSR